MKTVLRKIARLSFALIIPTMFLMGCQEDIDHPTAGDKTKIKISPGEKK